MKSILQDQKECYITKCTQNLHKHHIFYGTGNRKISERHGFWVWLRGDLHNLSNAGVHFNKELDLQLKQECQRKFEESHSREEFMKLIDKNYL